MFARPLGKLLAKVRTAPARAAFRLLALVNAARARRAPAPDTRTVRILLLHAYGMGGTIRTVFNLAGYLARERDVEIISAVRTAEQPFFEVPPGVRVRFLDDRTRPAGWLGRLLSRFPSRFVPDDENARHSFTLWTELRLIACLRSMRGGVVIATRPAFTLITSLFAPPEVITIGQEHVTLKVHSPAMRALFKRRYGRFDAFLTLTEADREQYAKLLRNDPPARLLRMPNAIHELDGGVSMLEEKTAVSIGRLVYAKGFDRLVNAWKVVAEAHPDWVLRIYGDGTQERRERLQARIDDAGLSGKIFLMGSTANVGVQLAKSSIYVVSSRYEGFGMTILEAMSKGLPVVSFDCPNGPREIITDGHDGLLITSKKAADLGAGICRLIEDEELRHKLGENALRTVTRYDLDAVGAQWDELLADLETRRSLGLR
ncbi:glycosyltransferase family 4 protein [Sphaerisporangium fuscum]|uniref:glycosyltransferase family 4 protein n=1 Tax=Sphaerisporangium fuscum TaxID=2835868 RepID=UPI0020299895|nr:glycosyltransferase family 4 protein [Sphaerisporangium fuscum]